MLSDDFFMIHSGPALRGGGQAPPLRKLDHPSFNNPYHQYATLLLLF